MSTSRSLALALFIAVLAQGSQSWADDNTSQAPNPSSHIALIRTYVPRDFHQSLLDRLAGGLTERWPYRMVSDSKGRILVTDPALSVIQVFDVEHGLRSQIGADSLHHLNFPGCIAVDADDNIYVTDRGARAVLVFGRDGRFLRTIGAGAFLVPTGITVDKRTHTLYVADWLRGEVLVFDLKGNFLQVVGSAGFGAGQLYGPEDVVLHNGALVVLDRLNHRFDLFDLRGNFLGALFFAPDRTPISFAFDGDGNLFYVDSVSGALVATDPQGKILASASALQSFDWRTGRPFTISFRCLTTDVVGGILAVGPALDIETLKIEADKTTSTP